jgi:GT2 family glycosyltransferase
MRFEDGLVSVIIINFNSGRYIERCIETIERQTYPQYEIIIVDNGSTDGSLALVRQWAQSGRVRLLEGENVGSSRANNRGILESHGEFVFILNADAFPAPNFIELCVPAFQEDSTIGTVTGKLVSDADPSRIDSAGLYFYREGFAVDRGFGEKDAGQFDRRAWIDGACCAAALYRRSTLEDIRIGDEFFDEDFFAFVEDPELSLHAALRGWKTLYLPNAVVQHVRGGSSTTISKFVSYLGERNTRLMFRKSFSLVARPADIFLQRIAITLRNLASLMRFSSTERKKMRLEEAGLAIKMDTKRTHIFAAERQPAFSIRGRRSFLVSAILRRLGIRLKV